MSSAILLAFAGLSGGEAIVDNQLITSDGDTFLTSDGDNFIVAT